MGIGDRFVSIFAAGMLKKIIGIVGLLVLLAAPIECRNRHVIDFRWPGFYPASFVWDSKSDHFVVGSARSRHLISVSDAGVVSSLLTDDSQPLFSSFVSVSIDPRGHRLHAVVRQESSPHCALASYELPSLVLRSQTHLNDTAAIGVSVDYSGNSYITDPVNSVVLKLAEQGNPTILSRSPVFKSRPDGGALPDQIPGLNGVVYNPKGYLLVVQTNSGKLIKVNADDGSAKAVTLNKELIGAEGIALRRDGVVLVASKNTLYFIKSDDSWSQGAVFDETPLDGEREAAALAVGAEDRAYVLYGRVTEVPAGDSEREVFRIVEVVSEAERKEENIWIFVLIGLGLAYFTFWRFQMKSLAQNMNKKTS